MLVSKISLFNLAHGCHIFFFSPKVVNNAFCVIFSLEGIWKKYFNIQLLFRKLSMFILRIKCLSNLFGLRLMCIYGAVVSYSNYIFYCIYYYIFLFAIKLMRLLKNLKSTAQPLDIY